jgi:hypothetical protein
LFLLAAIFWIVAFERNTDTAVFHNLLSAFETIPVSLDDRTVPGILSRTPFRARNHSMPLNWIALFNSLLIVLEHFSKDCPSDLSLYVIKWLSGRSTDQFSVIQLFN